MARLPVLSLVVLLAAPLPAGAHHGWADYHDQEFQLTGVVEAAELVQPHGRIRVRGQGGTWDVVLSPLAGIQRAGLTPQALPKGARVTAHGHRHRDPKRLEIKTERLTVGGRTYDLYPNRP